jgi:PAS domain-containing protein
MLAQDIDFHEIFNIRPTAMALFTVDLDFIDANEEFLQAVYRELGELIGRNVFDVLPKMPYEPGSPKWTTLEAALTSSRRQVNKLVRYDIEDPATPGVFHERYWSSVAMPIRGLDGHVEGLELSAREVTSIIEQFQSIQAEHTCSLPGSLELLTRAADRQHRRCVSRSRQPERTSSRYGPGCRSRSGA